MYRVVIADDEKTMRSGLAQLIASYQMDLSVEAMACDGQEAIDAVKKLHPQILLMDINMPRVNGLDAICEIRKLDKDIKIIILSGYDEFTYAQKALEYGVFSYLLKPLDLLKFRDVLQSAMDAYSQRAWEKNWIQQEVPVSPAHQDFSTELIQYISSHYTDCTLTLTTISDRFHVSSSYVTKVIKQATGMPFTDYLNHIRIRAAKLLLSNPNASMTIGEVADAIGYNSQNYFCRVFKSKTGLSPNQWRSQSE